MTYANWKKLRSAFLNKHSSNDLLKWAKKETKQSSLKYARFLLQQKQVATKDFEERLKNISYANLATREIVLHKKGCTDVLASKVHQETAYTL